MAPVGEIHAIFPPGVAELANPKVGTNHFYHELSLSHCSSLCRSLFRMKMEKGLNREGGLFQISARKVGLKREWS